MNSNNQPSNFKQIEITKLSLSTSLDRVKPGGVIVGAMPAKTNRGLDLIERQNQQL